jgi:FtsH-binding integral membrane protein
MNYLVWAMITAALLVFLYGVFTLMFVGGANEESRSKGRKFMFWGIVSLFVMVSVWGLVNILKTSVFGGGGLQGPQFKTNR